MKKKLFCLLLLLVLPVCLLFTGCDSQIENIKSENIKEDGHLLVCIDSFYPSYGSYHYVLVHKETKVMYLSVMDGGLTVMLDKDGKPLLYEGAL